MKMKRSHILALRLTFDKTCSSAEALAMAKNDIWGRYYPIPSLREDGGGPREFKVANITRMPKRPTAP